MGKREESIDLKFWANMIAKLGSDLYDGLHGKSGGISRDIFYVIPQHYSIMCWNRSRGEQGWCIALWSDE